jgi:hypothetical protein
MRWVTTYTSSTLLRTSLCCHLDAKKAWLSGQELRNLTRCQSPLRGDVISWQTATWIQNGSQESVLGRIFYKKCSVELKTEIFIFVFSRKFISLFAKIPTKIYENKQNSFSAVKTTPRVVSTGFPGQDTQDRACKAKQIGQDNKTSTTTEQRGARKSWKQKCWGRNAGTWKPGPWQDNWRGQKEWNIQDKIKRTGNMTEGHRTTEMGQPWQHSHDSKVGAWQRTRWPEHDSKDRIVRTGKRGMGQLCQDSQVNASGTGSLRQDSRDRPI